MATGTRHTHHRSTVFERETGQLAEVGGVFDISTPTPAVTAGIPTQDR